eukprot:6025390-Pyramimonas_sp.AAC.1
MWLSPQRAHIRLRHFQPLQGWRAGGFQHVALALAPRTSVFEISNSYKDGGRVVFKNVTLALAPRTFVFEVSNNHRDGGRFLFKNMVLALAPRTF